VPSTTDTIYQSILIPDPHHQYAALCRSVSAAIGIHESDIVTIRRVDSTSTTIRYDEDMIRLRNGDKLEVTSEHRQQMQSIRDQLQMYIDKHRRMTRCLYTLLVITTILLIIVGRRCSFNDDASKLAKTIVVDIGDQLRVLIDDARKLFDSERDRSISKYQEQQQKANKKYNKMCTSKDNDHDDDD
jgi:hypothetical protein